MYYSINIVNQKRCQNPNEREETNNCDASKSINLKNQQFIENWKRKPFTKIMKSLANVTKMTHMPSEESQRNSPN
jgi:hypothetical protein